jgi:hypothetical protein
MKRIKPLKRRESFAEDTANSIKDRDCLHDACALAHLRPQSKRRIDADKSSPLATNNSNEWVRMIFTASFATAIAIVIMPVSPSNFIYSILVERARIIKLRYRNSASDFGRQPPEDFLSKDTLT